MPHAMEQPLDAIMADPSLRQTQDLVSMNRVSRTYYSRREQDAIYAARQPTVNLYRQAHARREACEVIAAIGKRIGFPQHTISTAQLLLHRFYMFNAIPDTGNEASLLTIIQSYNTSTCVVMACLFVSSKIEDTIKKLKDIMMATYLYRHPNVVDWDPESKEGEEQRRRVLSYEKLVLESICFDFQIVHPYKYIVKFVKLYDGHVDVAQRAWQIASDCYKIGLCLELPPQTIAAGSIYLASRLLGEPFPETIKGRPWCEAFQCRSVDVEDFCHQIIDQLYLQDLKDGTETEQKQYTDILIELNEARSSDDQGYRAKRARLTYSRPLDITAELERIEDGGTSYPTVRYLVGGRTVATSMNDECCGRSAQENEQARRERLQRENLQPGIPPRLPAASSSSSSAGAAAPTNITAMATATTDHSSQP
ncbi:hypothetical protein BGW41_000934 [Actinomortierella wolfii]|nr:hypothetical protein BGW41_000934 [Actinomortierella wolfii]